MGNFYYYTCYYLHQDEHNWWQSEQTNRWRNTMYHSLESHLSLADTWRQRCQGWNIEGSCCSVKQVDLWPERHGNLRFSKLHFDHNQENKTLLQCPQCLPHRPCQAPSACRVWTLPHWKIGKKGFCHAGILIGKIGLEAGLIAWLFLPSVDWMWLL